MKTVSINLSNGTTHTMSIDEFTRWMCLAEAFHFIEEKAAELQVDVEKLIKPLAIESYIKERFDSMKHDVSHEIEHDLL